jgi:HAD superfamily hydrolase (TIGR01484 family)
MYKIVIFDLDGTAVPNEPNGMPSIELITMVKKSKDKIRLSAATGRPYANAKPILDALGLTELCIISGGTQIVDPVTGTIVWELPLEARDVKKVLDIFHKYPYELIVRNEVMGEGNLAKHRTDIVEANVMFLMECSESDAHQIVSELDKIPTITAVAMRSWTTRGIDIHVTNRQATKEHAVAELLKTLSLKKYEAVGVGDGDNDVHLFASVGHKVAMDNATDLLKSVADEVCKSVEDNGLVNIISKIAEQQHD